MDNTEKCQDISHPLMHAKEREAINLIFNTHSSKSKIRLSWIFRREIALAQNQDNVNPEEVIFGISLKEAIDAKSTGLSEDSFTKKRIEDLKELDRRVRWTLGQAKSF